MLTLANLPALLLVLNLNGGPDDGTGRGSASDAPRPAPETREVGFARLHLDRDIQFEIHDNRASETVERLSRNRETSAAGGLPRRLDRKRSRGLRHVCNPTNCSGK